MRTSWPLMMLGILVCWTEGARAQVTEEAWTIARQNDGKILLVSSVEQTPDRLPEAVPPTTLPNFLPAPTTPKVQPKSSAATPESGQTGNYDPSHLYLPEYVPPSPRRAPCPCEPLGRLWIHGSIFYGTINNEDAPSLIAAGGDAIVGNPDVMPLAAEDRNAGFFRSGFIFEGGYWLNKCQTIAIEGRLVLLESNKAPFEFVSNGSPTLGRSYTNSLTGRAETELIAAPGLYSGRASLLSESGVIGGEANLRENLMCTKAWRMDSIIGYRYLRLSEAIELNSIRTSLSELTGEPVGTQTAIHDRFATQNDFHGGQFGLSGEYRFGNFYFDASGKIAFGVVRERLEIDGNRIESGPNGIPLVSVGGLLTQPSNIGYMTDTRFAVVPEAGFSLGYQMGPHCRTFIGYTFLYMSNVGRPGHAIDTMLNPTVPTGTVVGSVHPLRRDSRDDFWMQGINLGLECRY